MVCGSDGEVAAADGGAPIHERAHRDGDVGHALVKYAGKDLEGTVEKEGFQGVGGRLGKFVGG